MRNRLGISVLLGAALALGVVLAGERPAEACGGCFAPPENPTVVTDHNMILSVSQQQTTLYDQIRYSGNPKSFAWVLPISGTAKIGLSSDALFQVLNQSTQTQIQAPPVRCPAPPQDCFQASGAAADSKNAGSGVTVLANEVVGPYETVTLRATDPAALNKWLTDNGFSIPADVAPVISKYVTEKFDFLAMKLVPGAGVDEMRPVSVSISGASPVLPLRMVAAGTGPVVGITLYIVGEGRYEPKNFSMFRIEDAELVWDWAKNQSNYKDLRKAKTDAAQGKIWELESSIDVSQSQITSQVSFPIRDPVTGQTKNDGGYLPITENGKVVKTAEEVRDADMATLFGGMKSSQVRVTRIRADLAHAALDKDLELTASANQNRAGNFRTVTKESGQPLCPVFQGCNVTGQAPRDQAAAQTAANNGKTSFACTTTSGTPYLSVASLVGLAGFVGLVIVRRRRQVRGLRNPLIFEPEPEPAPEPDSCATNPRFVPTGGHGRVRT